MTTGELKPNDTRSLHQLNDAMNGFKSDLQMARFLASLDESFARRLAGIMLQLRNYGTDLQTEYPNIHRLQMLLLTYNEESHR